MGASANESADPPERDEAARPEAEDAHDLLLRFVRDRDFDCPRCGYNLRNLTQPVCPECNEALELKVGVRRLVLGWLLVAVAPGFACGVAFGIVWVIILFVARQLPPPEVTVLMVFFLASALVALAIAVRSHPFLRLSTPAQAAWAAVLWIVHVGAFIVFLLSV